MIEKNDDGDDESKRGKLSNLLVHKVVPLSLIKVMVSFGKLCELLNCKSGGKNSCLIIGNQEGLDGKNLQHWISLFLYFSILLKDTFLLW